MEDEVPDELRRKKLAEQQKESESREMEKRLKDALRSVLDDAAYTRLSNVALANKELYLTTAQQALHAAKRLGRKLNEKEILTVLKAIKEQTDKDVKITFHKK